MSTIVTQIPKSSRSRSGLRLIFRASPAGTPYLVLWLTGVVAFVLCMVAFVLWGITGTRTLFDMMIALCT